ncbi:hypothetical protein C8R43DRAFT_907664, partial [Mycena crocata]
QNRQGKTRLIKWYVPLTSLRLREAERIQVLLRGDVHCLTASKDQKYQSDFVAVRPFCSGL